MTRVVEMEAVRRPRSSEEQRQALEAIELANRLRAEIAASRGGKPFPPSYNDLAELRAERDRELP